MIYAAYYDESDQPPGFAVAGYSASYETWVHLDWAWRGLLAKWKLAYFKASECENLLGEFAQHRNNPRDLKSELSKNEREKMIEIKTEFIDAICTFGDDLQGYGAVVIVEDFEKIIAEDVEAKRLFLEKPYFICFQLCLVAAAAPARNFNLHHGREDHVYIKPIFDSHETYGRLAKPLFEKFTKANPRSAEVLLPPEYQDDVSSIALQVADNLAYEARKQLTRQLVQRDDYTRKPMERLRPFIYRIYKLDYDALKLIVAKQNPDYIPIKPVRVEELW